MDSAAASAGALSDGTLTYFELKFSFVFSETSAEERGDRGVLWEI